MNAIPVIRCPYCARKWESMQSLQELTQLGPFWVGRCPGCGGLFQVKKDLWQHGALFVRPDWHSWVYGSAENPLKRRKQD